MPTSKFQCHISFKKTIVLISKTVWRRTPRAVYR